MKVASLCLRLSSLFSSRDSKGFDVKVLMGKVITNGRDFRMSKAIVKRIGAMKRRAKNLSMYLLRA